MKDSCWVLALLFSLLLFASGSSSIDDYNQAFPIVEPDPGHTKLKLSREGQEVIQRITTSIAVVAVRTWVWGTAVEMEIDGVRTSVFYLDTEGFESIEKSNVYDDRIFALETVLSSVLVYNLPETIREADISRLSFAVKLSEEGGARCGLFSKESLCKKWWMALRHVPNSGGDKNINQVNQIRDSRAIMGDNSTAFSLPQPHLQRTKLCDLKDGELDPA